MFTFRKIFFRVTSLNIKEPQIQLYSLNTHAERRKASYQERLSSLIEDAASQRLYKDIDKNRLEWQVFKNKLRQLIFAQPNIERRNSTNNSSEDYTRQPDVTLVLNTLGQPHAHTCLSQAKCTVSQPS